MGISLGLLIRIAIFACASIGLSGCGNLSSVGIAEGAHATELNQIYTHHNDLKQLVDHLAQPKVANGRHVGIAVGVISRDGQRHVFGYGETAKGSGITPDGRTIFGIGSLTKCFTELLLQDLVNDGTLTLDETVGEILPQQKQFSAEAKAITLGQLATHTSGLPRQQNNVAMIFNLLKYSFTGKNIYSHINEEAVYDYLSEFHPDAQDIGAYHYSNIGMGLLGLLIEAKTGKTLSVLMNERVLLPIGLQDTRYVVSGEKSDRMASGYVGSSPLFVPRNTPVPNWQMGRFFNGAAGLYSTADDLLTFAQYQLDQPPQRLVKFPIVHGLFDVNTKPYQTLAGGWEVEVLKGGHAIHYMHGMIAGYSAYIGFEYEDRVAVVVLYNNFDWDENIGNDLLLTLAKAKY